MSTIVSGRSSSSAPTRRRRGKATRPKDTSAVGEHGHQNPASQRYVLGVSQEMSPISTSRANALSVRPPVEVFRAGREPTLPVPSTVLSSTSSIKAAAAAATYSHMQLSHHRRSRYENALPVMFPSSSLQNGLGTAPALASEEDADGVLLPLPLLLDQLSQNVSFSPFVDSLHVRSRMSTISGITER